MSESYYGKHCEEEKHLKVIKDLMDSNAALESRLAEACRVLDESQFCRYCQNKGWYAEQVSEDEQEQVQCQWCCETPNSFFNMREALRQSPSPLPEIQKAKEKVIEVARRLYIQSGCSMLDHVCAKCEMKDALAALDALKQKEPT